MRLKKCIANLVVFFFCVSVFAQNTESGIPQPPVKTVYGELGGPGLFSINYDQRFKGQKGLGFRIGMGGIGFINEGIFAIPVGLNYLSGTDSHYLELGAGISAITASDGSDFFDTNSSTVIGYLNLGYRYQPEKKGFTARIFLSPLITGEGVIPFYGGISAGFRF